MMAKARADAVLAHKRFEKVKAIHKMAGKALKDMAKTWGGTAEEEQDALVHALGKLTELKLKRKRSLAFGAASYVEG